MESFAITGYNAIEKIGSGAFSEVYLVRCRRTGKYYAAKHLIDPCTELDDEVAFAEIQLMKAIPKHPHLIDIVSFVHENNRLTLIMSLMDMSLFQYIMTRSRPFSEKRARKMLFQVVQGLEHLHANGLFHRDIKPENILVKFSGEMARKETLQIADFGSAARISESPPHTVYIATRWYRAPECMLTMGYYGPKMDVWALGCCFYEMITLKPLFQGDSEPDMLDAIHKLLGSPSRTMLARFKHLNTTNLTFPKRLPTDLRVHLPLMTAFGIDLMRKTLAYHPDQRICAKKLLNHVYFEELVKHKKVSKFSLSHQSLNLTSNEMSSATGLPKTLRTNLKVPPMPSVESVMTNRTFHILTVEEKSKHNRKRERYWNMNANSVEKRSLLYRASQKLVT